MRGKTEIVKLSRDNNPCQFILYDEEFRSSHHGNVCRLITLARTLLLSSSDTADGSMLLAKAKQGSRDLLLIADRDNFEFILRMPGGRSHVAGGNLAEEMKTISVKSLEQMMARYLTDGIPIRVRANTKRPRKA